MSSYWRSGVPIRRNTISSQALIGYIISQKTDSVSLTTRPVISRILDRRKMQLNVVAAFALLAQGVSAVAVLRFGCSQIVVERLDPLVNPDVSPSPHIHQVLDKRPNLRECSSIVQTPDEHSMHTEADVDQVLQGPERNIQAREPNAESLPGRGERRHDGGFRMLAGHQEQREPGGVTKWNAICFRCFNTANFGGDNLAPCSDSTVDSVALPNKFCPGGIRTTVRFPTCWDGTNLDSPDHMSHVSYPASGTFENSGPCPATHPVKLPQLMFEVVWDTAPFNDKSLWPEDSSQPFVFSQGDNTGYGQHGDYVFGWEGQSLQNAMDASCFGATCSALKTQTFAAANQCGVQNTVGEDVEGWLEELPDLISSTR
ncbi:hypothetical protein CHU98_g2363 [Xylaria longipes]|nr:hypothetical protein CHU98_g2363 [Xylaria longipes]